MPTRPKRNAFLAMAMLADREHWCWNLACTTCGRHVFRHGLHELIRGVHPDSAQWTLHQDQGQFPEQFEDAPAPLSVTEQAVVSAIVSQLDVKELQQRCRFPDWLGFIGVVLEQTTAAEAATGLLTHALLPQLLALVEDPIERQSLERRFGEGGVLQWEDLEDFQRVVNSAN